MTTTTTRRTAKTTKPAYDGVVLARVYNKSTGVCLGYLAKPSKPVDEQGNVKPWYQVTCDHRGDWHCTCDATVECKHIKAVKEVCAIRVEQGRPGCKPAAAQDAAASVEAEAKAAKSIEVAARRSSAAGVRPTERPRVMTRLTDRMAVAPLNGNRGFSLMRR
jgi:hypothetical protein